VTQPDHAIKPVLQRDAIIVAHKEKQLGDGHLQAVDLGSR
jgi:hypothetical protein